jgi:hypothetical protein
MIVVVTGGRDFPEGPVELALDEVHDEAPITLLRHGACPTGADSHADRWARRNSVPVQRFPAEWGEHGRAAGPIRNRQMMREEPFADLVIAAPGGAGTRSAMREAAAVGLPIRVVVK